LDLVNYQWRTPLPRDAILVLMLTAFKHSCVTGMPVHLHLEHVLKMVILVCTLLKHFSVLIALLLFPHQEIDFVCQGSVASLMCVPILFADDPSRLIEL